LAKPEGRGRARNAALAQLGLPLEEAEGAAQPRGMRRLKLARVKALMVAGVDEAGRGPLAGPVVAAAVILDESKPIRGLADSKKLSPLKRERLFDEIRDKALCFAIAQAEVQEIDALNILQASLLAMQRAVQGLRLKPLQVRVDGLHAPAWDLPTECIVGGDASEPAISAASILAKVARDRLLLALHEQYPLYGFAAHKGYPTAQHLLALRAYGPCPDHRRSYAPVQACLTGTAAALKA
jgi:ribonuclease HII